MQIVHPAAQRGRTQWSWLDSWHSFSFGDFYDPRRERFGPLRVINEDWIAPASGFGMHGHRDMEILTVVLEGALTHRDSLGEHGVVVPGELQCMSAGRGIMHAEHNQSPVSPVHLLQIWIEPAHRGAAPAYAQRAFPAEGRAGRLQLVLSPDGAAESLKLRQDARVFGGHFEAGQSARFECSVGRRVYVHLARGELTVGEHMLRAGDALAVTDETALLLQKGQAAEVLVFDLP